MIALLQRVTQASVVCKDKQIASINKGVVVFIAFERGDDGSKIDRMANKIIAYRIFADEDDKLNLNVAQVNAQILLVSQFTLAANTKKGNRPGFEPALQPQLAKPLFGEFCRHVKQKHQQTQCGIFGANMLVSIYNDGPLTFCLQM